MSGPELVRTDHWPVDRGKGFIIKDLDEECNDLAIDNGLYC
jgi:hypothetical protein